MMATDFGSISELSRSAMMNPSGVEARRALFQERGDAFAAFGSVEALDEGIALGVELGACAAAARRIDELLDLAVRERGSAREFLRPFERGTQRGAAWNDAIHHAERMQSRHWNYVAVE